MNQSRIKDLLDEKASGEDVLIKGWVRTKREFKEFCFLEVNDGSCLDNIQVIVDKEIPDYQKALEITTGSSISTAGELSESPGKGQKNEIRAKEITIYGLADSEE